MRVLLAVALMLLLASCGDECSSYSDFSCDEIQEASYNVYFYYPSGTEEYIGSCSGLDACGAIAYSFASSKGMTRSDDWSYICCMKAKGSECYEKHR